jgi:acetylcholinesterase
MKTPNVLEMQRYFDDLVNATNCTDAKDRLDCLRFAPYSQLIKAVNLEPNIFSYPSLEQAWQPMIDGNLIPRSPLQIVKSGAYARVSTRPLRDVLFS